MVAALGERARSEGSLYVWIDLGRVTAETLLAAHRVAVAPGDGFGPRGAGFARVSLATADDVLDLGLERLAQAFSTA